MEKKEQSKKRQNKITRVTFLTHITPAALITATLVLLLLFSSFAILFSGKDNGRYLAEVYQNGSLLKTIPLYELTESQTFTVEGDGGCRNEIMVSPEGVAILSADCPDKLCVKQGTITNSKLPITCLPNRLVIQLKEAADGDDLITDDIIAY